MWANILIFILIVLCAKMSCFSGPDRYQRWAAAYFADVHAVNADFIRAVVWAESGGDSTAVSAAGAVGLMQVEPRTFGWIAQKVPELAGKDLRDPDVNVQAGTWYLRWCWDRWPEVKDPRQRARLMLASYNAGVGNIRKAWHAAQGGGWNEIAKALPSITSDAHAHETVDYVAKITRKAWQ